MSTQKPVLIRCIQLVLVIVPAVCSLNFTACSDVARTSAQQTTPSAFATYMSQGNLQLSGQTTASDPGPTYEWFY